MRSRRNWDEYFMEIARVVSSRATCDRKHVGALLVRDRIILSTGYNGSIRGMPHCDEVGHMLRRARMLRQTAGDRSVAAAEREAELLTLGHSLAM